MPGVSIHRFAALVGVSRPAVRKAIRNGRIERGPDGLIDPATALPAWHANRRETAANRPVVCAAAASAPPSQEGPGIARLQAADLALRLEGRRIDLDTRKGRLIDRAQAVAAVHRLAQEERDAILAFPARVGAEIAAEFGADPARVIAILDDRLRRHLAERGGLRPDP